MTLQPNTLSRFNPGFAEVVSNGQISVASEFLNTSFRDYAISGYNLDANLNNYLHYVSGYSDKSDYKLVDQLTELGCSHDQRNVFGLTPMMIYIINDMDLAVEKALIHGADPTIHDGEYRNSFLLADLHGSEESLNILEIFYMDGSPKGSRFKLLNKRLSDEIKDFKDPKITPELLTKESKEDGVSNLYQFARYGFLSEITKKLGKKADILTKKNIYEFGSPFAGHEDTPLQAHTFITENMECS